MIISTAKPRSFVVDVSMENAQSVLIDASAERPVLIFFWAEWSEPCLAIQPLLDNLANSYSGRFVLARVNVDALPSIASQLGVRALPTLILMQQGQPVDGLVDIKNEQQVRELLDKYLPAQWQEDVAVAQGLLASGTADDQVQAIILLSAAWLSSKDSGVGLMCAEALLAANRLDEADSILQAIPMHDRQSTWSQVEAQITVKREAGRPPEIQALEAAYQAAPGDVVVAQQLAKALSEHQYQEEALELLIGLLKVEVNAADGAVKKTFHDIVAALGKGNPLAVRYQRQLYALLY